ncbi:hypothetical protein BX666DRAFT_1195363 [Dichotomocladium elegans]|nr:hypothetical protein BX666DRAFT_1195363 [Dichotomocladium elegans]
MSKVMATKERISQILPTVKCSDCGEDVQIRKLGEHICSNMPPVPSLPILPQQRQDKHKMPPKSPSSISPLQSPKDSRYDRNYGHHPDPVTPPYYGLAPDLRRPSAKEHGFNSASSPPLREDSLRNTDDQSDYYGNFARSPKTPTFGNKFPGNDRPYPGNSTSPAPGETRAISPRPYARNDDYDRGYGSSERLAGKENNASGTGSLDNLMADLMSSLGSEIHDTNRRPSASHHPEDACAVCGDEFDYRDDVVNNRNKVGHLI